MIEIRRGSRKDASIAMPPSKAHTLRSLVLGALAEGTTLIRNPLLGEDQLHLIECLRGLGVAVRVNARDATHDSNSVIEIDGCAGSFKPVADALDCGESGVAMNFLASLACLSTKPVTLTGKEGLLRRPVAEIVSGVRQLGGDVSFTSNDGYPPLMARPSGLAGGTARMSGIKTSQYFSSLAVAAALANADSLIVCVDDMAEKPYFDITVEMMRRFGASIAGGEYCEIAIPGRQRYRATEISVESDYSSASYFIAAAAVMESRVLLSGLSRDSVQGDRKIVEYARAMGCAADFTPEGLTVTGGGMRAIDESFRDTPDLVPTVAIMAAFAPGPSRLRDVAHLKFKECDRIDAIQDGLSRMGIDSRVEGDDLVIEGNPSRIHGAAVSSYNDHRIAMSFAVAGLALDGQTIDDGSCVKKSFPDFWERFSVLA